MPQAGDLILAREAPVGNIAIIPPGLKICLGQRTVLIRPDREKVNPRYLLYFLLSDRVQGRIQSMASGATVGHLNVKDIRDLDLPELPSLSTQTKIGNVLSSYDDLIENNTRRIRNLEEMAQAIYREWFVHFRFPGHKKVKLVPSPLGPIPTAWRVGSIAEAVSLSREGIDPGDYSQEIFHLNFAPLCRLRAGTAPS